ncbi:MAG: tetratricopeptide repeat protein, partial [Candidatus Calescibacterium sp.]
MKKKKSFFKKLVVVIISFILISVLSCARKKSENQSGNLNGQILQALGYIENGEFNYAEKLLQEVKAKDPENCEASYGLALIYLRNLVEIVNSVLSIAFGLGEAFGQSPGLEIQYDNLDFDKSIWSHNEIKRLTKKANLSDAIRSILEPSFTETEKIVRNIQIAVSKRCYIRVALPIRLGTEKNTIAHFFVGEKGGNLNKWGPTEAAFIGFFANIIDAIFKFIFVINWDINIEKLIDLQAKINLESLLGPLVQPGQAVSPQEAIGTLSQIQLQILNSAISTDPFDTVALFASLAYIIDTSPDLLKLQKGSERILDEVPQHLTVAFDLFIKIFEFITNYSDKDSIIAYQDLTGDGLSSDDFIALNVFDYPSLQNGLFISIGRSKIKIDKILISTLFRPFLFKETRERYLSVFTRFRDAFDIKNEKIPESQRWINLQYALSLIPFISVQDTVRFNPKKFFEGLKSNPEGFRAILPVWTDITGDGVPEFIIEAEAIGISEKFCFAPVDRIKSRFIVKPLLELRGEEKSQLRHITIIYSKGEITQDFWCSISPYLTPVAGREYQASISAEMYINNIELNIETKELNFSVLPCDLFAEDEVNFVCYVKEKN